MGSADPLDAEEEGACPHVRLTLSRGMAYCGVCVTHDLFELRVDTVELPTEPLDVLHPQ